MQDDEGLKFKMVEEGDSGIIEDKEGKVWRTWADWIRDNVIRRGTLIKAFCPTFHIDFVF